ncbi:Serine protease inhibitor 42Dd [Eumeta japonica]|uniref:Serine protease inhibitor 42Dd n=1 Tax=Eumeta variegata TaxID=151549 RepID=A0A4C2A8K1_EUMVA|nr:Serine protease inhibitor 42Dd [Eumeta japonica]
MVSPASVKSTLAMLLEASQAETADEIRTVLRLSPNREEFREQLNFYLSSLQANASGVLLENVNAVFVPRNLKIKRDFQLMLQHVYLSGIYSLDFTNPVYSSNIINSWVSNKTRGYIPSIIEPVHINPSAKILLMNAMFFKSSWLKAFNPLLTKSSCFYTKSGCVNVATMEVQTEMNYAFVDNLRAHAVELPYEGGKYSMVILVPQERGGCASLIRDLPYMSLPQIIKLMEPTDMELYLPRFKVDYSVDLVPILKNMGIRTIFSSSANISSIFEDPLLPQVNNVFHKTHLEVNEQGTVAAAATGAMVIPLIGGGVQLKVDRPFVFFIKDNSLGSVLFEGKIEHPEPINDIQQDQRAPTIVNKSRARLRA